MENPVRLKIVHAIAALLMAAVVRAEGTESPAVFSPTVTLEKFVTLAPLPRKEFTRTWGSLYQDDLARLRRALRGSAPGTYERESTRLRFRWAQGRVMYPFFHWRESDDVEIVPDPEVPAIAASLPVDEARWWDLKETREYVDARIHDLARERLRRDTDLRTGDARWLRARLRALDEVILDRALRLRKTTELLAAHVEDDGARSIDDMVGRWLVMSPPEADVARMRAAIDAERARDSGHRKVVYRVVGGIPLALHVLTPSRARGTPAPAMLWFHGGSATEGIWWHSPGITQALLDEGIVVIAVELTTGNRFDADADQISDSSAAFDHVRAHAADLGVDSMKIGVAGFSSGASLALLLGTRGSAPAAEGSALSPRFPRPAAVIASGACADPLSRREDGYFRKSMAKLGDPAQFSPYAQLRMGLPPVLAVHATRDEFCAYEDMVRFIERSRELGNAATLVSVQDASHFFGFYHEVGKAQLRAAITSALEAWGW
jgi:acetyl esterase/lipase